MSGSEATPPDPASDAPDDAAVMAEWAAAAADPGGEGEGEDESMLSEWAAAAGQQLDQSSIDSLFGEVAATGPSGPRNGFEVLVGNLITGFDRLPMLDIVVDRLARALTSSVRKLTADTADVSVGKTRPVRLGDFLNQISLPALIAVVRAEQWDGYCLVALDSPLIGSIVDIMLGGRRNDPQPIEGRPYTPIERTLIERFVTEAVTGDMRLAFEAVCTVDFVTERFESTPSYAAITKLSAASVTFRAEVAMDGGRGGRMDFLIPYAVLEPVRDVLSQEFMGKKQSGDTIWRNHLREEVPRATVELRAVMEHRQAAVSEVARWRAGSLLLLDRRADDPVDLFCEDLLVARAQIGENSGRIALRIEDCCLAAPEPAAPGD